MRLLQLGIHDGLSLTTHDSDKLPPYAILSHTWGSDDDELAFKDVENGSGKSKAGYQKVLFCGQQAQRDDLKDFWVDTCCVDKRNHSELSEAIISMFRWYQKATKCYVYLNDVSALKHDRADSLCDWKDAFRKSRWFTRGWTLQELLAPKEVEFWSRDRHFLGTKETLKGLIHEIVDVPLPALLGAPLSGFSTPERLRWATKRGTKREEDKAYCLFGIFDVSLPILYGEGGDKAFGRLETEIRRLHNPICEAANSTQYRETTETTHQARREKVLASLAFEQIDSRHSTIKDALHTTCGWLLQHPDYIAWNNKDGRSRHHGILWIAGKPGAGKSTLVKFILAHARKTRITDEIILDFFFNARGDYFEKTTLGMYRALLIQLLNQAPDLQSVLDHTDESSLRGSQASTWTLHTLQNLLHAAVRNLGSRKLRIFVDALDECDEEQVRDMVEFLEDLGQSNSGDESQLSICLASRHYPSIEVRHSWRLVLEDEVGHADDLRKYIHRRLQAGKGKTIDEIRTQVQEKANGVFMWVVLVVGILNEEFRRGRIFAVKQRLREIPTELSELFKDLLRRDCVNMDDLFLCLQWILFAKRPLEREEFYFAMEVGLHSSSEDGDQWRPQPWDPEEVTADDMNRFVLNSSKGLAELTKSQKAPTVQFIHESVRDFLLKDRGLQELWPELVGNLAILSHNKLRKCCSDYLAADLSSHMDLPQPLPKASFAEARILRQRASSKFPFLKYANQAVLHHADAATNSACQETFLPDFALDKWVYMNNLLEPHENRRYSHRVSLLYILAANNLPRLIKTVHRPNVWLRLPLERYQFPVLAAFANGHRDALQVLLGDDSTTFLDNIVKDPGFDKASQVRSDEDPLLWAVEKSNWAFAECLLTCCSDEELSSVPTTTSEGQRMLLLAVEHGTTTVVQKMLNKIADVNVQDGKYDMAMQVALKRGHEGLVQMLIGAGVDVSAQGRETLNNALYAASYGGHEGLVQTLIDAGADVNAQGGLYDNALQAALYGEHAETMELLLDNDADINAQAGPFGNPLQTASFKGYERVVQLLLDRGADVNAQGGVGGALHAASCWGHEKIVQLLLDRGADINAQAGDYRNALQAAASTGHQNIVQLLLDRGADVNAKGGEYGSALQAATSTGHQNIVQLLLDRGADANTQGGLHGSALRAAIYDGHQNIVQLLLDRGADFNAQVGDYGNALCTAASMDYQNIVQLLLDRGADVNAQGGVRGALQAASYWGHEKIVQLLLDRGADINAQDRYYGTALQGASYRGNKRMVQLLLNKGADVHAEGGVFGNALGAASSRGHTKIKRLLLRGANTGA